MNDIAFKVIIKNDGIDDVIFKTLMLKGEKGDKGDAGGADIDDSTTASNTTWSSNKIRAEIDEKPDNLSELDDVDLDAITDEQLLGYNFTSGKWENKSVDASTLKYDSNTSIKEKIDDKADIAGLATVATSGDYDDLSNKPTIPSAQVNSDWNATSGVAEILNKPTIPPAQVNSDWNASSGVAEILNKPTIPVVDQTLNASSSNAIANSAVKNAIDDIEDEIALSSVLTPTLSHVSTSTGASEKIWIWKSGKVVTMAIDIILDTTGSAVVVMQLPTGFRPPVNITANAQAFGSASPALRYVQIYSNGNVAFYSQDATRLLFTMTFGV